MKSYQHTVLHKDDARYVGGPRPAPPRAIILHCTGGDTAEGAITWLNRLLANGEGKASYHYLIDKDKHIYRTCDPMRVAFHAGRSVYPDTLKPTLPERVSRSVNISSIGIAWVNDNGSDTNTSDDPLTEFQHNAGLWLCVTLCERFGIPPWCIYAHRQVSPGRKTDPLPSIIHIPEWRSLVTYHMNTQ